MITPYLNFSGNCEAAFKYYEKHLGGKTDMIMRYADAPPEMPVPQEHKNYVMHAHMTIAGAHIMGADAPPERYNKPVGFSVSLEVKDLAEAGQVPAWLGETDHPLDFLIHENGASSLTDAAYRYVRHEPVPAQLAQRLVRERAAG